MMNAGEGTRVSSSTSSGTPTTLDERRTDNGRDGSSSSSNAENERRCTGWGASRDGTPNCLSCGNKACGRRLGGKSRMTRECHVRIREGGGLRFLSATRLVVRLRARGGRPALLGSDAQAVRGVLAVTPSGQDPPDRVWPPCGGPDAQRGLGKPETFKFLGSSLSAGGRARVSSSYQETTPAQISVRRRR